MKLIKLLAFILINNLLLSQITTVETPIFLKREIEFPYTTFANALNSDFDFPIGNFSLVKTNPSSLDEQLEEAYLYLGLDFGENFVFENPSVTFNVLVNIEYKINENSIVYKSQKLIINQTQPEFKVKLDIRNDLLAISNDTDKKLRLKISFIDLPPSPDLLNDNFTKNASTALMQNYIENKLILRASTEQKFGVDVREAQQMAGAPVIQEVSNINKLFTFKWTSLYNFPNYEVQILRLHNIDETKISDPKKIGYKLNWDNALKVETQSFKKEIKLTLMEGTGYYVWRVRPVGNFYEGGIANQENYGLWSQEIASEGELLDYPEINNTTSSLPVFYYNDQEENLNWIYTRTFTEGDLDFQKGTRTKEGISYADHLLRTRQTQVYNSEENTSIVGQSLIDYSGRPSLSTLPVPIAASVMGLEGYVSNFVKSGSNLYTALYFDEDGNAQNPSNINDGTGSHFSYYNNQNPIGVSGTDGKSFTRTIYKTDGTNRPSESSGIGAALALGTTHTTQIFYGSASDDELIRVFGDEAPLAESVIKTIVIDPNGTQSVTYTSKEGKTIATAMITDYTDNLLALNANPNHFVITHSTTQNIVDGKVFQSTKRIVLSEAKDVTLKYEVLNGAPPCTDCKYRVQFYLIDLINQITYVSDEDGQGPIDPFIGPGGGELTFPAQWKWVTSSGAAQTVIGQPTGGQFQLPKGEYLLVKKVYSADEEINTNELINVETILSIIAAKMSNIQNDQDISDFNLFMNSVAGGDITPINDFIEDPLQDIPAFPSILVLTYTGTGSTLGTLGFHIQGSDNPDNPGTACAGCADQSVSLGKGESCRVCDEIQAILDQPDVDLQIPEQPWAADDQRPWVKVYNLVKNGASTPLAGEEDDLFDGFIEYLKANEVYHGFEIQGVNGPSDFFQRFAPGFDTEKLTFMLTNMLVSKYYVGNIDENGNVAEINATTGMLETVNPTVSATSESFLNSLEYNYTCKDLFACWVSAVDMIKVNEFENEEVNVMDQYNDQADDSSEDEYDNEENQEDAEDKSGFDKLSDFIISQKMRKFNDSDEGKLSNEALLSLVNLPNMFLACGGYQFAGIIDEESINSFPDYNAYNGTDVSHRTIEHPGILSLEGGTFVTYSFSTETTSLSDSRYKKAYQLMEEPEEEEEDQFLPAGPPSFGLAACDGSQIVFPRLAYPYILKPEWMFKYFEYNAKKEFLDNQGDDFSDKHIGFTNQFEIELASCYNDLTTYIQANCSLITDPNDRISCKKCSYYHEQWNSGQRLNFYKQLKGSYKVPPFLCNDPVSDLNQEPSIVYPYKEAKKDLDEAIGVCDSRKGEFMQIILNKLDAACYNVVECVASSGNGTVTMDDVDYMAQQIVKTCIAEIKKIGPKIGYTYTNPDDATTTPDEDDPNFVPGLPDNDYSKSPDNGNRTPDLTEYPFYHTFGCANPVVISNEGGLVCDVDSYTVIKLFTDCDQAVLDLANSWNLNLDIQPVDLNNCSTYSANGYQYSPPSPDCSVNPGGTSPTSSVEAIVLPHTGTGN